MFAVDGKAVRPQWSGRVVGCYRAHDTWLLRNYREAESTARPRRHKPTAGPIACAP